MLTAVIPITCLLALAAAPEGEPSPDGLVAQLGAPSWQEREAASEKLFGLGKEAMPALERALQSADPEVRHRARILLDRIRWQTPVPLPPLLASAMEQFPTLADDQRLVLLARVANELRGEAVPLLRQVLRTDPSPAVRRMAMDRLAGFDPSAAEAELRALAAQPASAVWAAVALGDVLARCGETDKAIEAYEAARKAGSKERQVVVSLARLYEQRKDFAKARDLYTELVAAEPEHPPYRLYLGRCHYLLGDHAKAEAVWSEMLRTRAATPQAFLWLASAYDGVGARDKALAVLRDACQKHPQDLDLLRYLGWRLDRYGRPDEAIQVYEQALRAAESEHHRRNFGSALAALLRQTGRLDAYLARQKAEPAGGDLRGAALLRRLAEGYLGEGDRASATRVLERLRTLYPDADDGRWAEQTLRRIKSLE